MPLEWHPWQRRNHRSDLSPPGLLHVLHQLLRQRLVQRRAAELIRKDPANGLGAIGLVSDYGVRDLTAVRKIGFHYFARGAVASHARYPLVRTGLPIHPGNLPHAGENGLITIPESDRDRLPSLVEEIVRDHNFTAAQFRAKTSADRSRVDASRSRSATV